LRRLLRAAVMTAGAALLGVLLWRLTAGREPLQVHHDLAAGVRHAQVTGPREVLLFGTPGAEPHLAQGFYATGGLGSEAFVWARPEVELSFTWDAPQPRTAILDLAPLPGLGEQSVRVALNGQAVGELRLGEGRGRHRLSLPAAAQRAGENRLAFAFARSAQPAELDPTTGDRRTLAAAFHAVVVGLASDAGLDDLLARDAPSPLEVVERSGAPALVQTGPSAVRYAFVLRDGQELRFTPALHDAARAAAARVRLRVTLEEMPGVEQELWSREFDPRAAPADEVRVSLAGWAGRPVRLGFHVEGAARYAWGIWGAPRLLGRGPAPSLQAPAWSPAEDAKTAELRRGLAGTSVVFVILDAARAFQFGAYGYPRTTTPNIDALARDGVVFERAYTPAVYTLAAMSAVWTAQYPDRHRSDLSFAARLPKDKLTLAEVLSARGVPNAGFVNNAMAGTALGFERGFDEFHEVFRLFPDLGSRGEAMRRVVPDWIARHRAQRFFAYVHYREPHFPFDPGPPFTTMFGPDAPLGVADRRDSTWYKEVSQGVRQASPDELDHLVRLYDGNLAYVDREVGELVKTLEREGLLEKTVLIIAADHGEQLFEKGYIAHSAQVHEESTRIPMIVRFPKALGLAGKRLPGLVDLLDVAPTVLDVFGLADATFAKEAQGRSLLPMLAGAPGKPAVLSRTVWERPVYALRDGQFKLIHDTRSGRSQLYDVESDPRETADLHARASIRAEAMEQALYTWLGRLKPVAGSSEKNTLTREQCENMKALGYLDPRTPCPES
jgi:arylsulfatase A-like enzyme